MGGIRRRHGVHRGLTPWGWALAVALVVLIILAVVDSSPGVYIGLIAVVVIAALLLNMSFPSPQSRGMPRGDVGRTDFGGEATGRYRRERGLD
jgi:hypothetical protein